MSAFDIRGEKLVNLGRHLLGQHGECVGKGQAGSPPLWHTSLGKHGYCTVQRYSIILSINLGNILKYAKLPLAV
jgi:hypothetical protein